MNAEMRRYRAQVAEEYLEPIRKAGRRLRARQVELMEERRLADGLTGIDYTKPFVTAICSGSRIPAALERLAAMEDAYRSDLDALEELRAEARARLDQMGGRGSDLLKLRYVSALPWNTVADGMGLSEGTCRNARADALSRFYDYLPHTAKPPAYRAFDEKI